MGPKRKLLPSASPNLSGTQKKIFTFFTGGKSKIREPQSESPCVKSEKSGSSDPNAGIDSNDTEPEGSASTLTETTCTPKKSKLSESKLLKFQDSWIKLYNPWLKYEKNIMWCSVCRDCKFSNTMAVGTSNFKTITLQRHVESCDHKRAMFAPRGRQDMNVILQKSFSDQENCITMCMKIVFWMAKESILLSKYTSLMGLLNELNTSGSFTICIER